MQSTFDLLSAFVSAGEMLSLWQETAEDAAHRTLRMSPPGLVLAGIDERTALIRAGDGTWRAEGAGQVVVFQGGKSTDLTALPA